MLVNGIAYWTSVGGLIGWLALESARRKATARRLVRTESDRGTTVLLIGCFLISLVVAVVLGDRGLLMAPSPLRLVGSALLLIGLILRASAFVALGSSYTRMLSTSENQRLVTAGPYRLVRHPGYLGTILVWIGFALGLGSFAATILVAALLVPAYLRRISVEEQMLAAGFGQEYEDYRLRTWRLLPWVF